MRARHELDNSLVALSRQGTPGPGAYEMVRTDKVQRRQIEGRGASAAFRSASPQRPLRPGEHDHVIRLRH